MGAEYTPLSQVDKQFSLRFLEFLQSEYKRKNGNHIAASTATTYFLMLNAALNAAVQKELIDENPFKKIPSRDKIHKTESKREFLTVEEVRALIATPVRSERTKNAYLFSCFCGLRISDIRNLKWKNVHQDGEQTRLEIVMRKTKEPIYLPLSNEALRWMPKRENQSDDDFVFSVPRETHVTKVLLRWAKDAGISKHVTFHTARHTFATMMLTLGADLYTTSKLLGHTNVQTTQIYAKIVNKKKDEAVNLVNGLFD